MHKGHLNRQRANVRSTKATTNTPPKQAVETSSTEAIFDRSPNADPLEPPAIKTNYLFADCQNASGQILHRSDGPFPRPLDQRAPIHARYVRL
jgi:hypothetical protein